MDFIEELQNLSTKTEKLCNLLQTEEATKNALIMPFIKLLGYDIFDPTEVVPEFIADVGIKKGEKVVISNLNDIYNYGERLRRVFAFYEGEKKAESQSKASI